MNRSPEPRRRHRRRRGASVLELALALPILLGMILATVDLGRFVTGTQRAAAAAAAAADLASQAETFEDQPDPDKVVSGREFGVVNVAAREVARPLALFDAGAVIVTVVSSRDGAANTVAWRRRWGRTDIASAVGPGAMRGVTLGKGEGAVFAEVGYRFEPFVLSGALLGLDGDRDFHAIAVRRPRLVGPTLVAPR